jgi:hypothetical protein
MRLPSWHLPSFRPRLTPLVALAILVGTILITGCVCLLLMDEDSTFAVNPVRAILRQGPLVSPEPPPEAVTSVDAVIRSGSGRPGGRSGRGTSGPSDVGPAEVPPVDDGDPGVQIGVAPFPTSTVPSTTLPSGDEATPPDVVQPPGDDDPPEESPNGTDPSGVTPATTEPVAPPPCEPEADTPDLPSCPGGS